VASLAKASCSARVRHVGARHLARVLQCKYASRAHQDHEFFTRRCDVAQPESARRSTPQGECFRSSCRGRVSRGEICRGRSLFPEVWGAASDRAIDRSNRSGMAQRRTRQEEAKARCVTFTFDTGMLIALERRKRRALEAFQNIIRRGFLPIVPAVVYAEWWRGRTDIREEILAAVLVEDMGRALCRAAGMALGAVRGSTLADAVVMASAALRGGGVVYTGDAGDLRRLGEYFPSVLILQV
jgi:predicted nucleic acid-binding protein